jgi:protein-S-isoprenylcysteine O-methyltransferase Ste14
VNINTMPKLVAILLLGTVAQFPLLFWPAGTWNWPGAWAYLALIAIYGLLLGRYLMANDPALMKERMTMKVPPKGWDRVVMPLIQLGLIAMPIVAGFDRRFGWSQLPPWLVGLGILALAASLLAIAWVMRTNTHLSMVVEIQEERGHQVVTDGPYAIVRHPMYVAAMLMAAGLALTFGSGVTLGLALFVSLVLVVRTALEDRTLHEELAGYAEYAAETRYRLLPGLW